MLNVSSEWSCSKFSANSEWSSYSVFYILFLDNVYGLQFLINSLSVEGLIEKLQKDFLAFIYFFFQIYAVHQDVPEPKSKFTLKLKKNNLILIILKLS